MRDNNRELYSMPQTRRYESNNYDRGFEGQEWRYHDRDSWSNKGPIKFGFPHLILVPEHYNDHITEKQVSFLDRIKELTRVHHIYTDKNLSFEELKCKTIYINDLVEETKNKAMRRLVDHFLIKHMKHNPRDEKLSLSILIPEQHCSMFIGKEGKNIKSIMSKTRTQIDLDTKVYENGHRPVSIKGDLDSIIYGVEQINECIQHF